MRYPMTILAGILAAYVLVCLVLFLFQSRLIFYPDRVLVANPRDVGLVYEDVFMTTDDGARLHGWFIPAEDARYVLLFFHGNAGNVSHRLESIRLFNALKLSVFIIDYRGFGHSEGKISEHGTYEDAQTALEYLTGKRGVSRDRIIYFGRSLGSAVAVELATHDPPRALIDESCFPSIPAVAARSYPLIPVRWLARFRYDSLSRVASLDCPKLFVHSRGDELLPFALAKRVYAAAAEPKTFLEIEGDHNSGFITSGATYIDGLVQFLSTLE